MYTYVRMRVCRFFFSFEKKSLAKSDDSFFKENYNFYSNVAIVKDRSTIA